MDFDNDIQRRRPTTTAFEVVYVGTAVAEQATDALCPPYGVQTVESIAAAAETIGSDTDCVIIEGAQFDRAQLQDLARQWPTIPLVLFVDTADEDLLRIAFEEGCRDVVSRTTDTAEQSPFARLRERVDRLYWASTADIADTILDVSRSLISAAPSEIDARIEWGMEAVGQRLDATESVLYRLEDGVLVVTHTWTRDDHVSVPDNLDPEQLPGFTDHIRKFEPVAMPQARSRPGRLETSSTSSGPAIESTPSSPQRATYLTDREIQTLVAAPVVIDWELEGVIIVGRDDTRDWPARIRRQLQTFGELIGHAIRQRNQHQELQRQNDRLERFASVVAHDLQNPLNVIDGYAERIEATGDTQHAADIRDAVGRMEVMLDELLELAREKERLEDRTQVALEQLATDTWDGMRTKQATLQTKNLGVVRASPNRLRQVFENLFRNAIEHGGDDVTVRVVGTDTGFAVEDDGPGIPESKQDLVFEEGYTAAGGTGLGLAIVKRIIDAHGWQVSVTGGAAGGARFEITTDTD